MSLDINELNISIYTALNVDSITGSVSGVYHVKAPQGTDYPFITYFSVIDTQDDTFTTWGNNTLIQIDVWSDSNSAAESGEIVELIAAQMDDKVLSISGYDPSLAIRQNTRLLYEDGSLETGEGIFHQIMEYSIRWGKNM